MANNKITQEELVKYIMFTLQGYNYLQSEAKGDAAKLKALENEIENIGTKRVSISNVGALLNSVVQEVLVPQLQSHSKELLLTERVIRGNAVSSDKLEDFVEELHKNGDISDKSYKYFKSAKINVSDSDFKQSAKEIKAETDEAQEKLKEAKKLYDKDKKDKSDKATVAKTTYDDSKSGNVINLNGHRK